VPHGLPLRLAVRGVRSGHHVPDVVFDRIYPPRVREVSSQHWTPIAVARRAAELLVRDASTHVLDIGAGAGKFCLVGALTSPARFTGIEQRGPLVYLARAVAREYGVSRARYLHGDMRALDWQQFDAFYLFNPFAENQSLPRDHIDDAVELSPERYERDVLFVAEQLALAPVGTRVVTYHGFGAEMPVGYQRRVHEPVGSGALELWVRTPD
jgi:predicted RNA methylase